jgi:hypothetical protein
MLKILLLISEGDWSLEAGTPSDPGPTTSFRSHPSSLANLKKHCGLGDNDETKESFSHVSKGYMNNLFKNSEDSLTALTNQVV